MELMSSGTPLHGGFGQFLENGAAPYDSGGRAGAQGGGGIPQEFLLKVYHQVLQILTLFQAKTCYFAQSFSYVFSHLLACAENFPPVPCESENVKRKRER